MHKLNLKKNLTMINCTKKKHFNIIKKYPSNILKRFPRSYLITK